ncbi:hypothetical protein [Virgibacillus doumboii]|uniref:hypothetical protein n=1 Tax=Virgibacillus doumboii TaxID=2697503 RepID=UPI0013E05EB3|nr:hypothetical protein [Virgibacillus doumboii]
MDLIKLQKHSKAVLEANKDGVDAVFGNEILLDKDLFHSLVTEYDLRTTIQNVREGRYHVSFSLNGIPYYSVFTEAEYQVRFTGHKKMTS